MIISQERIYKFSLILQESFPLKLFVLITASKFQEKNLFQKFN